MPRASDQDERRRLYAGASDGMSKAIDLVTATAVWGAIGWLIDRWLGTWPIVFAIGTVIGNLTGIYILYRRSIEEGTRASSGTAAGVTRSMPRHTRPARGDAGARVDGGDDE
ncbi:MAG TPA: AtpZ/AtpI family protein [Actinomycetota bacterium]|nr:AtpZ/AtpI family protein [Actinomycetota bacterium]